MVRGDIVLTNCQKVKGEVDELIFVDGSTKVRIVGVDFHWLIDELKDMGYLREYVEENKDYFKDCLEGVR